MMFQRADRNRHRRLWSLLIAVGVLAVCVMVGCGLSTSLPRATVPPSWIRFGRDFLTSPGLGGLMAVVAALIALAAALTSSRRAQEQARADRAQRQHADSRTQWWSRAEWALNASAQNDPDLTEVGQKVLESLSASSLTDEQDAAIIAAATRDFLDDSDRVPSGELEPWHGASPPRRADHDDG